MPSCSAVARVSVVYVAPVSHKYRCDTLPAGPLSSTSTWIEAAAARTSTGASSAGGSTTSATSWLSIDAARVMPSSCPKARAANIHPCSRRATPRGSGTAMATNASASTFHPATVAMPRVCAARAAPSFQITTPTGTATATAAAHRAATTSEAPPESTSAEMHQTATPLATRAARNDSGSVSAFAALGRAGGRRTERSYRKAARMHGDSGANAVARAAQ